MFGKNVQKCEQFSYGIYFSKNVYILVFSAGNIIGMVGGNYYWYGRAVIITGIVGGNYYWYSRAEILYRRAAFAHTTRIYPL